jgi:ABC-type uncharacterized transport system ATPase subunit
METAVHLDGITKRFPGVVANDNIDFEVKQGTVHALLGENGAGKTTLMNVLYGLYEPTSGRVEVAGEDRDFDSPRDAIDAGIGMIHQHFMLVDPMTVVENITLGNEPRKWGGLAVDRTAAREAVVEIAGRYGFDIDPNARIEDISVGEQQRVEILKALYRGADTLILDEPTAVLTPQEIEELFGVLEELTAQGKTIIFITHKLGEAMRAADEITVLRDGQRVDTVDAGTTTRNALAELMIGREVLLDIDRPSTETGGVVASVSDLVVDDDRGVRAVDTVDFEVCAGEILGIAGVDGNGQSELIEAITGLRAPETGTIRLLDDNVTDNSRRQRIEAGMAYIPEDRQDRGVVMDFDLVGNALLGSQHSSQFQSSGRVDWDKTREHAKTIINKYDVRTPGANTSAASLSGGNQQKFIVGREFERNPEFVVASNPTRGVDVGSIEFIHERLLELREAGVAVLLVSSKLKEVQGLSDRLAVMYEGEFIDLVDPTTTTESELGLLMAGQQPDDTGGDEREGESDLTEDPTDVTTGGERV